MKYSLLLLLLVIICGCDPEDIGQNPNTFRMSLSGTLNNTSETIRLGDTIRLEVKMPDTVTLENSLSQLRTEKVVSLQRAWYVFRIFRVDSVNREIVLLSPPREPYIETSLSAGVFYSNPSSPYLQTTDKPYHSILNIVPKSKGIFYIEIVPQMSSFMINRNLEGLLSVNITSADKHLNIIASNYKSGSEWLADALKRDVEGFGLYAFRVN